MNSNQKILAVEDMDDFRRMIEATLKNKYTVKTLENGSNILNIIQTFSPDLILLDINLPGDDGFRLCSMIQGTPNMETIPIIFLSAREKTADKVMGLTLGADDYIVKPFEPAELLARVEAKLRKQTLQRKNTEIFRQGNIEINRTRHTVNVYQNNSSNPAKTSDLSRAEYKLLNYFLTNEGAVLSREQILDHVWGNDVHVLDRTVDSHISSLRKKISPYQLSIESVYGSGYRFSKDKTLPENLKKAS